MSVERERLVQDIERALVAAAGDPDAAQKCEQRTLELRKALDRIEDAVEWPRLVAEANKVRDGARGIVNDPDYKAKPADRSLVQVIERDLETAVAAQDRELVRQRIGELRAACADVLISSDVYWIGRFQFLSGPKGKALLTDQKQAAAFIQQGQRAINNNDLPALQAAVRQLEELLPIEERASAGGFEGGTQR
jgi:molecular chaperone DnaK